jgi:hypothetical protein
MDSFYAHTGLSTTDHGDWQPLREHLESNA